MRNLAKPRLAAWGLLVMVTALAEPARSAEPPWPETLQSPFAAHNAYPWRLYGPDRLKRALAAGIKHVELDLTYDADRQAVVVTHDAKPNGQEPTLDELVAQALTHWQATGLDGFTLILDFKTTAPEAATGVKRVLDAHAEVLSSLPKAGGEFRPGKVTVCLTGSGESHRNYYDQVPADGRLLAFGDVGHGGWQSDVAAYVPAEPAGFVRFVTLPRICFQDAANSKGDEHVSLERLRRVVELCDAGGYRLRIYSYNPPRVMGAYDHQAWEKSVAAGVHMIATDAYEDAQAWWAERVRTQVDKP